MQTTSENNSPAEPFAAFRKSLEALPSSGRINSAEAEAIYALVHSAILQGQHETALRYLALLTFLKPTEPRYLAALALTYKHLDLHDEALKVYAFLVMLEPAELQHPLSVAECYLYLDGRDMALPWLHFVLDSSDGVSVFNHVRVRAQALLDLSGHGASAA